MPETAQHLLGQVVDGRFPLRKLLGVSANSAVFLTSIEAARHTEPALDAAIKLTPENPATWEAQLERWRGAAALSHPGVLRLLHFGRCTVDGAPCLYVVSELADEDLGQLLPQRALTAEETQGMLEPVVVALDYLHENGLVHAGLKPSNIHAIGNQVKLSADRIVPAGMSAAGPPLANPFAAPESALFPAADIWSLGMSICEALKQSTPAPNSAGTLELPELPAPFAEIVRAALVTDPTLRISLDSVRSLLDPTFVAKTKRLQSANEPVTSGLAAKPQSPEELIAAVQPGASQAAAASAGVGTRSAASVALPQIDPLSVPLSPVEPPNKSSARAAPAPPSRAPIPVATLPQVNATVAGPRRPISPNPPPTRSNKLFLVAAATAIGLVVLLIPRLLLRSSRPAVTYSEARPAPPATAASPARTSADSSRPGATSPSKNIVDNSTYAAAKPESAAKEKALAPVESTTAAAGKHDSAPVPTAAPAKNPPAGSNLPALGILRKVLPEVSEKARATISGTVRINVNVQLNADGTVASADLNSPASSKYFADLALKAARQWQFAAGEDGTPPTSAVIRFDFTATATAANVVP